MTSAGPAVSVIVPHLNQPGYLRHCLNSLAAQANAPGFDVIIVDNGSLEPPEAVVAEFPFARLVVETTAGPGPARNRGVAESGGTVLAFTDADCRPDAGWLAAIWRRLGAPNEPPLVIGGAVKILTAAPNRTTALEAYERLYAYRMEDYITKHGFTATANLAVRRDAYEVVGGFGGISIAEDRDWCHRASRLGMRVVYEPAALVWHPARPTFVEVFRKWDRLLAHDYRQRRAGPGGTVRWVAKATALIASPLVEVPRIARSSDLHGAGTRVRAFGALSLVRLHRARRMFQLFAGADPARLSGAWNRTKRD